MQRTHARILKDAYPGLLLVALLGTWAWSSHGAKQPGSSAFTARDLRGSEAENVCRQPPTLRRLLREPACEARGTEQAGNFRAHAKEGSL